MTKYKILTGSDVIYDSSNKYEYPVTEPVLNLELGEAGNLEFTILPGHPQHGKLLEMQTFVSAYRDDKQIFYGRVLQADEDVYHQIKITCEGALTFLLDSEMEPGTYTETMSAFFARCIAAHNNQVESAKQFAVGVVQHEEADKKLEFKLEGYNQTRQVLDNLLTGKYGGFLNVRYENGRRYLDYIQQFSNVNNQPIKTGLNVIDRDKHISGENLFTIVRPLGKNGLTIEGASSVNLLSGASIKSGAYLEEGGGEEAVPADGMRYSTQYIPVSPGATYWYGPGKVYVSVYDEDYRCIEVITPNDSYSVTIPEGGTNVRLSYYGQNADRLIFMPAGDSVVGSGVHGKILAYADPNFRDDASFDQYGSLEVDEGEQVAEVSIDRERVLDAPDWNYDPRNMSANSYVGIPGLISLTGYDGDGNCIGIKKPSDDIGCESLDPPLGSSTIKISFQNIYGSAMRVIPASQVRNLAAGIGSNNGKLERVLDAVEAIDSQWCYTETYIPVEENTYYTGGPSQIKVAFYDENYKYLGMKEANREDWTMHYVKSPAGAKFARVCFLSAYRSEQQLQKGKALILTKLDPGTKTILMPARIAKYGQIVHTEQFSDIDDPQTLYNAAVEWIALHQSMLPASADIGLVDLHLLNPDFDDVELGDVYDNLEGFEGEAVTVGSRTIDMENPANDKITVKNLAELSGSDAGKSSGSLSSKYASSGGGGGSDGNGSKYKHITDMEDDSFFGVSGIDELALEAFRRLNLKAANLQFIAEDYDNLRASVDIIARNKSGAESRLSLASNMANVNADNIVLETKNLYNIANNVFTVADTVFTHANLIWNEAKHIVTIAENLYTVADHIAVVADTIDIIAGDINILADNINITADRLNLTIDEITAFVGTLSTNIQTINAKIGDLNVDIGTITGRIGSIDVQIGSLIADIAHMALRIGTLDLTVTEMNLKVRDMYLDIDNISGRIGSISVQIDHLTADIGTLTVKIGTLNADIQTINAKIGDLNVDIGTITGRIGSIDVQIGSLIADIAHMALNIGTLDLTVTEMNLKVRDMYLDIDNISGRIGSISLQVGSLKADIDTIDIRTNSLNLTIGTIDDTIKTIFGSNIHSTADQLSIANGILQIDSSGNITIADGSGLYLRRNNASFGVYDSGNLTAGIIAETLTGQSMGNKTALRLLGDEIDLKGNAFISGFLDVQRYITAGDYRLKDGVKIGVSGTNVSLVNSLAAAFDDVSVSTSGSQTTLTFTKVSGETKIINFNGAAAALANVDLDTGSWSNGSRTLTVSDGDGNTLNTTIITIPDPTDYAVGTYISSSQLLATSFNVGGKPFSHNFDASSAYQAGQDSVYVEGWSVDKSDMPTVTVTVTLSNGIIRTYSFNV